MDSASCSQQEGNCVPIPDLHQSTTSECIDLVLYNHNLKMELYNHFSKKKNSLRSSHCPAWPRSPVPIPAPQFTSCFLVLMQLVVELCSKLCQGNFFWIAAGLFCWVFLILDHFVSPQRAASAQLRGQWTAWYSAKSKWPKVGAKLLNCLCCWGKHSCNCTQSNISCQPPEQAISIAFAFELREKSPRSMPRQVASLELVRGAMEGGHSSWKLGKQFPRLLHTRRILGCFQNFYLSMCTFALSFTK